MKKGANEEVEPSARPPSSSDPCFLMEWVKGLCPLRGPGAEPLAFLASRTRHDPLDRHWRIPRRWEDQFG